MPHRAGEIVLDMRLKTAEVVAAISLVVVPTVLQLPRSTRPLVRLPMRTISAGAVVTGLVLLSACAGSASSSGGRPSTTHAHPVVTPLVPTLLRPPVAGRSYSDWEIAWRRWREALPARAAPTAGACIARNQHGPVWFLGGDNPQTFGIRSVRHCVVPADTDLMIGAPGIDCSTIEKAPFYARTDAGLGRCASREWYLNRPSSHVSVDGRDVRPAGILIVTPAFRFSVTHNQPDLNGRATGRTVVAAEPAILGPLTAGRHVVIAENEYKKPQANGQPMSSPSVSRAPAPSIAKERCSPRNCLPAPCQASASASCNASSPRRRHQPQPPTRPTKPRTCQLQRLNPAESII
jgi:hypothetical protein